MPTFPAHRQTIPCLTRILDAWLPAKVRFEMIPSLSIGIVIGGEIVYRRAFGLADIRSGQRATPETQYRIASISKTFTGIALLQLVERGLVRLADPVNKHVPWFMAGKKSGVPTIRDLLLHRSGIWRDGDTTHWIDDRFPALPALRRHGSEQATIYPADRQFKYSNYGYALLGQVIEAASGLPYEQYLDHHIFRPLHMTSTAADYRPAAAPHLSRGYGRTLFGRPRPPVPHSSANAYNSAAGLLSTSTDLCRFLAAMANPRRGRAILSLKQRKLLMASTQKAAGDGERYGFGLGVSKIGKNNIYGHGGGYTGFTTNVRFDPQHDIGIVVLSNSLQVPVWDLTEGLFELLYYIDAHPKFARPSRVMNKKFQGVYQSRYSEVVLVPVGNGFLIFDPQTNRPIKRGSRLEYDKKGELVIAHTDRHDSIGERVWFSGSRQAQIFHWATVPMKKIR